MCYKMNKLKVFNIKGYPDIEFLNMIIKFEYYFI